MSDVIIVAVIMSATTLIQFFLNRRDRRKDAIQIKDKLEQVHGEMNGMKDELVRQSGELGQEQGNKQGRKEEKAEQKIRDDENK